MKAWSFMIAAMIATPAVHAQDLAPAMDAAQIGQGQVLSSMVRNHGRTAARRSSGGGATAAQISACAQKAQFRSEYGADNPKVQRLYGLCRSIGR
jgi:hypothetical protein